MRIILSNLTPYNSYWARSLFNDCLTVKSYIFVNVVYPSWHRAMQYNARALTLAHTHIHSLSFHTYRIQCIFKSAHPSHASQTQLYIAKSVKCTPSGWLNFGYRTFKSTHHIKRELLLTEHSFWQWKHLPLDIAIAIAIAIEVKFNCRIILHRFECFLSKERHVV